MFKIGVMVESYRAGLYNGLRKAKAQGADGVQIYTTSGDMAAWDMTKERRAEIKDMLDANGLVVSALCGDLGGHGFMFAEHNADKIEKSKRVMDLSLELGSGIVTTHIGVVPEDASTEQYKIMQEACHALATYADSVGAKFALETGAETPEVLKAFLDSLNSKGLSVNYDPANLVMVLRCDPVAGVYTLGDYIVHTHAKDGVNLVPTTAEKVYANFSHEDVEKIEYFREVPLGTGGVDFPKYIAALKDVGYNGFLTIERECGDEPEKDIGEAVTFLNQIING